MTDKEKSKEYAIAVCFNCKKNISKNACNRENYENCCNYVNSYFGFYHGYKAGLSDREKENDELEKENEELKELSEINSLSKVLIQRCKEVGIKDLYHLANYLTIIENQKHQIEKMKCCQNCNHNGKPEDFEHCLNCDRPCASPNDEIIKGEWELAE